MDQSIIVTYKDGHEETFSTLEEASESCGLSESALKIRANKSRQGSIGKKDKIGARWVSDKTFRSYQAKKSKSKGQSLEFEIVNKLKEIGYANVCRSAGESKKLDNSKVDIADPSGELEVAIQAKNYANTPNYFKIREECPDPREFVLIWKKAATVEGNSKGTVAIIDVEFFYKLLKVYHEQVYSSNM